MPWTNPIDFVVGQATCVARFDEQILSNIDFAGSHGHTGSAGDGALRLASGSTIQGTNYAQVAYQYISVPLLMPASSHADVTANYSASNFISGTAIYFGGLAASIKYLLDMTDGTWEFSTIYRQNPTGGKFNACLNGSLIGALDVGGTANVNVQSSTSRFSISTSGTQTLKIEDTTGSGGAPGDLFISHVHFYRVSA